MTDFKNIKHFNCSLDFNLTHLLTVGVMLSSNAFLMLKVPLISGSCVIHIVIVIVLCLPIPSV